MPYKVTSEDRKYTRYAHTADESQYLKSRGLRAVISSNVSAVGVDGNTLIVRFHGGATYGYPEHGDRASELISAPSKGKWVWRNLRRAGVPYYRMGAVNIKDDVEDRDMMKPLSALAQMALISTMVTLSEAVDTAGIIAGVIAASVIENTSMREQ